METNNRCPRCGEGRLRVWSGLDDEEREVVRRLPAAADYDLDERKARHRWCSLCWYEESTSITHDA
jgi:ribosomal protein L32